ncbi:MAG: hypothetical protein ACREUY_10715 [Burkholderiales bacterium]
MQMRDAADTLDTRPWYDRVRDWVADSFLVNAATSARDMAVAEAEQAIAVLYAKGMEFQSTLNELLALSGIAAQSPELRQEYDVLVARGNTVNTVIRSAVRSVQNITAWARDNLGLTLSIPPPPMLSGLGLLPLIPAALIGGVIAATALAAAWIVDARSGIEKIRALQALAETVPIEQRADVIGTALRQSGGLTSAISGAKNLLIVGAIIAAGIYFAPQLKRLTR